MQAIRRLIRVLGRDSVALMGANLNYALIGVITGIVTARALGPEGRGDLAVVVFWPTFIATLVEFGLGDALTLWVARQTQNVRGNVLGAFSAGVAVSTAGVLIGLTTLPLLLQHGQQRLLRTSDLCLALVPAYVLSLVPVGALLGLQLFRAVASVRVLSTFGYLISVVCVVLAGRASVASFMWLNVFARTLPLLIGMAFLARHLRKPARFQMNVIGQAKDGSRLHTARLATVLASSEDRAIASWTLSQGDIGQWQIASTLIFIVPFIAQGVSQHLYGSIAAAPEEQRVRLITGAYTRSVLLTAVFAAALIPMLPFVIPFVYGHDFAGAITPAIVVVTAAIFSAGTTALQAGARAAMQTRICIESELVGALAMAGLAFILIPQIPLSGLAFAFLGGRLVALAWLAWRGRRTIGWTLTELLPSSGAFKQRVVAEWNKIGFGHE